MRGSGIREQWPKEDGVILLCVNLLANIQCHQHNQDHLDTTIQTLEGSLAQPLVIILFASSIGRKKTTLKSASSTVRLSDRAFGGFCA